MQPSTQQLPNQHPTSAVLQQPEVAQTGEQAGAQTDENLAATTIITQPQASAVAQQPQKQKRKLKQPAETGRQETGSEAATAKDTDKKKTRKKQKKDSDVEVLHPSPSTPAAEEDVPEEGVPAATQHADQVAAVSDLLNDTIDTGILKSGQLFDSFQFITTAECRQYSYKQWCMTCSTVKCLVA